MLYQPVGYYCKKKLVIITIIVCISNVLPTYFKMCELPNVDYYMSI